MSKSQLIAAMSVALSSNMEHSFMYDYQRAISLNRKTTPTSFNRTSQKKRRLIAKRKNNLKGRK